MNYKKLILLPFLPVCLIANLQAIELSNAYNSVGASYQGSLGDEETSGFGVDISSEIFETDIVVGLSYASTELEEVNDFDVSAFGMISKTFGIGLGYVYSVDPNLDIIPSISYSTGSIELLSTDIADLTAINFAITSRYQLSNNSILKFGFNYVDVSFDMKSTSTAFKNKLTTELSNIGINVIGADYINDVSDSASGSETLFSLGYEYGLTEDLILDLGVNTSEFDTFSYSLGVRWSWGS